MIIFGSVRFLSKKVTKSKFFFKKTETGSNQPVSVRFGFLGKNRFKPVCSVFQFGSVLARFFSVSVWFGFLLIKPKPNRTGRFFQKFNRFFFRFGFFGYFFSGFLGLIGFLVFLLTLNAFLFVGLFLPHISNRKLVELT